MYSIADVIVSRAWMSACAYFKSTVAMAAAESLQAVASKDKSQDTR